MVAGSERSGNDVEITASALLDRPWHRARAGMSVGFSLHTAVVIADTDRAGLERSCRYGARPAFAQDRLAWTDDGWSDLVPAEEAVD